MAEKKEPMAKAAPQQTAEKKEPKGILYPAKELAKAAHRFNTKEECVVAALKYFGKKEATIKETEESPNNDLDKELEELSKKKHPSQFSRIDLV